jgi:hypothetical protein
MTKVIGSISLTPNQLRIFSSYNSRTFSPNPLKSIEESPGNMFTDRHDEYTKKRKRQQKRAWDGKEYHDHDSDLDDSDGRDKREDWNKNVRQKDPKNLKIDDLNYTIEKLEKELANAERIST